MPPQVYAIGILHPAHIMRGKWGLEPAQVQSLKRAWEVAQGTTPYLPNVENPPPGAILTPTMEDMIRWRTELDKMTDRTVAADIECVGPVLLGIGFCRLEDEVAIYVPFRTGPDVYWPSWKETERAALWVDEILGNPRIPKVFHNGVAFDAPYLTEMGFDLRGFADDTMVMQHLAFPEMPKSLQFTATLHAGMPSWKWLAKLKEEGEGK